MAQHLPDSKQSGCAKVLTNFYSPFESWNSGAGQDLCSWWNSGTTAVCRPAHERCYQRQQQVSTRNYSMCFPKPGLAGSRPLEHNDGRDCGRRVSIHLQSLMNRHGKQSAQAMIEMLRLRMHEPPRHDQRTTARPRRIILPS